MSTKRPVQFIGNPPAVTCPACLIGNVCSLHTHVPACLPPPRTGWSDDLEDRPGDYTAPLWVGVAPSVLAHCATCCCHSNTTDR